MAKYIGKEISHKGNPYKYGICYEFFDGVLRVMDHEYKTHIIPESVAEFTDTMRAGDKMYVKQRISTGIF